MAHVLIVGAGIAGDTLALLLERDGWDVTVVDIAPALRTGGQTVDMRGDSRAVLIRLGLLEPVLQCLIPQAGAAWVDADENCLATMPVTAFDGRGLVSKEELLRTDLARILHSAAGPAITHRFGDTVEALENHGDGVYARFRSGDSANFDLVVGADGLHSQVRRLCFGPEAAYRQSLGLAHAWFTLNETPDTPSLNGWFLIHNAPARRMISARPGHAGQQQVGMTLAADTLPARADRAAQQALLERAFADVGWRAQEFLSAARTADDFVLDTLDQVHMPAWHVGRVVLLGDSAWSTSPLSGLGTALALRGAAELADALRVLDHDGMTTEALSTAMAAFEATMRPRVISAQTLPPGRVKALAPKTSWGIRANALAMRALQTRIMRPLVNRALADSEHGRTA